jgi:hypothetical protein
VRTVRIIPVDVDAAVSLIDPSVGRVADNDGGRIAGATLVRRMGAELAATVATLLARDPDWVVRAGAVLSDNGLAFGVSRGRAARQGTAATSGSDHVAV